MFWQERYTLMVSVFLSLVNCYNFGLILGLPFYSDFI